MSLIEANRVIRPLILSNSCANSRSIRQGINQRVDNLKMAFEDMNCRRVDPPLL